MNSKTRGFSSVEVIIILAVLAIIGGLGYVAWNSFTASDDSATDRRTVSSNSQKVEVITSKEDLEAAEKTLEDLNFDDESAQQAELQAQL